ncbi:D-hexose-6-phosphate mutarotase [Bermanella marisrubri]|uniref:Putative glucose-6-phosphate 1-epimerase n=1 Tax=Bermanella marisrubri TaxID=207949 RepID=Q1N1P2_9GAMM|nr:D-hexose-6-phosphate mutarotase [Bermanella marisrubri]EAT12239.1 hypothetical protein RED65_04415 [Oceanobacter sp. RED65] [Bermanella marisrubri]QIZ83707.1 D-hexose-6-phosphate mutarotase [Bermanella marisrubri]
MSDKGLVFCKIIFHDELPCLQIEHPKFQALICLQGAQLLSFVPTGKQNLLWLSPLAEYKTEQSPRGGIPICWPWFGNAEKNPPEIFDAVTNPEQAHGFARNQLFDIDEVNETAHKVQLSLMLSDNSATREIWPHAFELKASFTLSDHIEMTLSTKNIGNIPFSFTEALHSYLPANIKTTQITGAEQQTYVDALDKWVNKLELNRIGIQKEVDRIVRHGGPYRIIDSDKKEHLLIESDGKDSIIWNPWIDKSKRLSQFPDHAYQSMLCIESANILDNVVTLAPGQTHSLDLSIKSV